MIYQCSTYIGRTEIDHSHNKHANIPCSNKTNYTEKPGFIISCVHQYSRARGKGQKGRTIWARYGGPRHENGH